MTLMKAHAMLGHPNMEYTKANADHVGWELTELNKKDMSVLRQREIQAEKCTQGLQRQSAEGIRADPATEPGRGDRKATTPRPRHRFQGVKTAMVNYSGRGEGQNIPSVSQNSLSIPCARYISTRTSSHIGILLLILMGHIDIGEGGGDGTGMEKESGQSPSSKIRG